MAASKNFNFKKDDHGRTPNNPLLQSAVLNLFGAETSQYQQLPIALLDSSPLQHYYSMDTEEMESLADSIRLKGVLQPIVVRTAAGGRYEILAGHRRTAACKLAGLDTIPALIYVNLDDESAAYIFHVTNLESRNNISPSEQANAYAHIAALLEEKGFPAGQTTAAVAKDAGVTARTVQRYNRLAKLNKDLLQKVDEGSISVRAANELSYLPKPQQKKLAQKLEPNQCLSHDEAREIRLRSTGTIKGARLRKLSFAPFARFFAEDATKKEIIQQITAALEYWQENNA